MDSTAGKIVFRLAMGADVDALAALLGMLFEQEADFEPDAAKQKCGLEMILADPDGGKIFCAEVNGVLVAMASVLFVPSARAGGMVAWLEDVIVHPGWRGHGLGRRLLDAAILAAGEAGCVGVVLLTDSGNVLAREFYGRAGFAPTRLLPMRLVL